MKSAAFGKPSRSLEPGEVATCLAPRSQMVEGNLFVLDKMPRGRLLGPWSRWQMRSHRRLYDLNQKFCEGSNLSLVYIGGNGRERNSLLR